jgi:hypothetical protein
MTDRDPLEWLIGIIGMRSHAMVRSTIHRLGTILKPIAVSERLTI